MSYIASIENRSVLEGKLQELGFVDKIDTIESRSLDIANDMVIHETESFSLTVRGDEKNEEQVLHVEFELFVDEDEGNESLYYVGAYTS